MKLCTKCGETKPLEDFHRDQSKADGRSARCRECTAEDRHRRYEKYRDKELESRRRYYEENRDKELERHRRYYEENLDKQRELDRKYYEANLDYLRAAARAVQSESQAMSAEMATVPPRTPWAEEEDAVLMADNGMTVFQKAVHLGRTYLSCKSRRHHLRQSVAV